MLRGPAIIEDNVLRASGLSDEDEDADNEAILISGTGPAQISGNEISGYRTAITANSSGSTTVSDNILSENEIGISAGGGSDWRIDGNTVTGGTAGIIVTRGHASITNNVIEHVANRGLALGRSVEAELSGNHACGNGEDLWVADGATATIEDDNEFCVVAPG